jgi:hypothetical protein
MNDRLDDLLARLPQADRPAPDLAARIILAVALRRQARRMGQRVGAAALACGLAGLALTALAWPEALSVSIGLSGTLDATALTQVLAALLADPLGASLEWLNSGLAWQASLAQGASVALTLGLVLLAAAAFGALARLLAAASAPDEGAAPVASAA